MTELLELALPLRDYQQEALDALEPLSDGRRLVSMCCGAGKTRVFTRHIAATLSSRRPAALAVAVFPSLALMQQYREDYVAPHLRDFSSMAVCSLPGSGFTTDKDEIAAFLRRGSSSSRRMLVTVTYCSFALLLQAILEAGVRAIDALVFDEAHHLAPENTFAQTLGAQDLQPLLRHVACFTATPVKTEHLDMTDPEGPCGPTVFEYPLKQAIEEGVCKPVDVTVLLYRGDTLKPDSTLLLLVADMLARAANESEYAYCNMLTFHRRVNPEAKDADAAAFSIDCVKQFATEELQTAVGEALARLSPEQSKYTQVLVRGLHSGQSAAERDQLLAEFDQPVAGRLAILASCDTLNEGVDSKWANQAVTFGPSSSVVKETQRTGRLARKPLGRDAHMPPGRILIPVPLNMSQFSALATKEERDAYIRQELGAAGNFGTLLNVTCALQHQDDPDLFEKLLNYPEDDAHRVRPSVAPTSYPTLQDALSAAAPAPASGADGTSMDTSSSSEDSATLTEGAEQDSVTALRQQLRACAKRTGRPVELQRRSNDQVLRAVPKGAEEAEPIIIVESKEEDGGYQLVGDKRKTKKKSSDDEAAAAEQRPPKRKPFRVETHPDLQVLIGLTTETDLEKDVCLAALEMQVKRRGVDWKEHWKERLGEVEEFIERNGTRPSQGGRDPSEKKLASWIGIQLKNTKDLGKPEQALKDPELLRLWQDHIARYERLYEDGATTWKRMLAEVEAFIDSTGKRPRGTAEDAAERKLGRWIWTQLKNAKDASKPKHALKDPTLLRVWQEHVTKYERLYEDTATTWKRNLTEVEAFIDSTGKRPNKRCKDKFEAKLAKWISHQLTNANDPAKPKDALKNPELLRLWQEHVAKYERLYEDGATMWKRTLGEVETFIDSTGKRPRGTAEDAAERKLGRWIGTQLKNAKDTSKPTRALKDPTLLRMWQEHVAKYERLYEDGAITWKRTFAELEAFIERTGQRPNKRARDPAEKKLANWITVQLRNTKDPTRPKHALKDPTLLRMWQEHVAKYERLYEDGAITWKRTFAELEAFIERTGQRPNKEAKHATEKRLGIWTSNQLRNAKDPANPKEALRDPERFQVWQEHVCKYEWLYEDGATTWKRTLAALEAFIECTGKRPSNLAKEPAEKKLANWIGTQLQNAKDHTRPKDALKNPELLRLWQEHVAKYHRLYEDGMTRWKRTLAELEEFIVRTGKRPKNGAKDPTEKMLATWISNQLQNAKDPKGALKDPECFQLWQEHVAKYQELYTNPRRRDSKKTKQRSREEPAAAAAVPSSPPGEHPDAQPPPPPPPPVVSSKKRKHPPAPPEKASPAGAAPPGGASGRGGPSRPSAGGASSKRARLSVRAKAALAKRKAELARQRAQTERLTELLEREEEGLSAAEQRELERLVLNTGAETFRDTDEQSAAHAAWKKQMNSVFCQTLLKHHGGAASEEAAGEEAKVKDLPVVYLDGPALNTTRALKACFPGHRALKLFVANDCEASAAKIAREVDYIHVGDVCEALEDKWRDVPFAGAYLDLCTGTAQVVERCLQSLLHHKRAARLVVGYTLTCRDPLGETLVNRLDRVRRTLLRLAREAGYIKRVKRVESAAVEGLGEMRWQHQQAVTRFFELE